MRRTVITQQKLAWRAQLALLTVVAFGVLCGAQSAAAAVLPTGTLHGPDDAPTGVEVAAAAMADDGTGGVVFLRQDTDNRAHVFVARYANGAWDPPQRVDNYPDQDQAFTASWPRIAAADGGRLVVVWVEEYGATDRLYSASLGPGARLFTEPVPIDLNIRESNVATFPSLSMNGAGVAYLSYRVVTDANQNGDLVKGYVRAETRIARFNSWTWSKFEQLANRSSSVVLKPSSGNSPKIAVDGLGDAVVAFQEPDDEFIDRVWARRIFGTTLGLPLLASLQSYRGAPLRGPVDSFALSNSTFGAAAVAYSQQPGSRSPLSGPSVFVNTVPSVYHLDAGTFSGSRLLAEGVAARSLSTAINRNESFSTAIDATDSTLLVSGSGTDIRSSERLEDLAAGTHSEISVAVSDDPVPTNIEAWISGGGDTARLRYSSARAGVELATLNAGSGSVSQLRLASNKRGDAIVAYRRSTPRGFLVEAAIVDAPPGQFELQLPVGWQRKRSVPISWSPTPNSIGPVTYEILVDGRLMASTQQLSTVLHVQQDGRHRVAVVAVDWVGQRTLVDAPMRIDRRRPTVRIGRHRHGRVTVNVTDESKLKAAGIVRSKTSISWGDGSPTHRATQGGHTYKSSGRYLLVVRSRDRAGNTTLLRKRLIIRR